MAMADFYSTVFGRNGLSFDAPRRPTGFGRACVDACSQMDYERGLCVSNVSDDGGIGYSISTMGPV